MPDIVSNKPKSAVTGKPSPKHGCCGGGATSHASEPEAAKQAGKQHAGDGCCGDAKPAAAAHSSCGDTAASGAHKHHRG